MLNPGGETLPNTSPAANLPNSGGRQQTSVEHIAASESPLLGKSHVRSLCPETHGHTGGEGNFRPRIKPSVTILAQHKTSTSIPKRPLKGTYLKLICLPPLKLCFQPCCHVNFPHLTCFAIDPLGSLTRSGHTWFFHNQEIFNKILKIPSNIISRSTSVHHLSSGTSMQQFAGALWAPLLLPWKCLLGICLDCASLWQQEFTEQQLRHNF